MPSGAGLKASREGAVRGAAATGFSLLGNLRRSRIAQQPAFGSRSLSESERHMGCRGDGLSLRLPCAQAFGGYRESMHTLGSSALSLACIDAEAGYDLSYRTADEYSVHMALQGHGSLACEGREVTLDTQARDWQVLLIPPLRVVRKQWHGPGQVLCLHIPSPLFEATFQRAQRHAGPPAAAAASAGSAAHPREHGDAPSLTSVNSARLGAFLQLLGLVCQGVATEPTAALRDAVGEHTQQLLIALFLDGMLSDAGASSTAHSATEEAPDYLLKAEAFIRNHLCEELALEDLAAAAGVSTRTLQYAFKRFRSSTPTMTLKQMRFEQARLALQQAAATGVRVSDVALNIGYSNFGQFSRDYKQIFGESPSRTASKRGGSLPAARD